MMEDQNIMGDDIADESVAVGTIPSTTVPEDTSSEEVVQEFQIPDAYKDAKYLKDVESYDDVFKKLDGAQKLLGQRPQEIPGQDASDDDWNQFFDKAGRPESADKYEFKYEEGQERNEQVEGALKGILHEAGLSQRQVDVLQPKFDAYMQELAQQQAQEAAQKADNEFDEMSVKMFGDKTDQILSEVKTILNDNKPDSVENFDEYLNQMSNKDLLTMAGVINNIKMKYMKEDSVGDPGSGQSVESVEDLREEGRKLMASEAYTNSFHPDHESTATRVQEIYATIGKRA